jgi:hypothetical protein
LLQVGVDALYAYQERENYVQNGAGYDEHISDPFSPDSSKKKYK